MKAPPTRADRLFRLKTRLGWRPHKFYVRIKPGGWIALPPGLGVRAGDAWTIERIDDVLVLRRIDSDAARHSSGRRVDCSTQPYSRLRTNLNTRAPWKSRPPCSAGSPRPLVDALAAMPDVGNDSDFARAAEEMHAFMKASNAASGIDLQQFKNAGRD